MGLVLSNVEEKKEEKKDKEKCQGQKKRHASQRLEIGDLLRNQEDKKEEEKENKKYDKRKIHASHKSAGPSHVCPPYQLNQFATAH